MKISVITPVYNRVATVGQAVQSVLSQTHREVELLVQDGGSSDGTLRVLRGITDARMKVVSEPDQGIYDALNRGIRRATGDVIGLMHSDDFFAHDQALESVADGFSEQSVDGVYGDLDYVSVADPTRCVRHWRGNEYEFNKLKRGWMPPHPTLYLRRHVFDRWGLYDTRYRIAADYEAILRWTVRGHINLHYIPGVMVKMRLGGESNRSLVRICRKSYEDYCALRAMDVGGFVTLVRKNISKISQFFMNGDSV